MKPWYASGMGRLLLLLVGVALFVLSCLAKADVVSFPEEELSRESVYPVFDQPEAVKKRHVPTMGRYELEVFGGGSLNDAFLSTYTFGLDALYHLNELHAVGLYAGLASSTTTNYVGQIQNQVPADNIPFSQNPTPSGFFMGEYEFTPYYGKISLSKQTVLNVNVSAVARLGIMELNPSNSSFAGSLGLSHRFFLSPNFGIKLDLQLMFYEKADILSQSGGNFNGSQSLQDTLFLTAGVLWLLPSL